MSTVTAPIQIGLLLLSTTATGVLCFLCGRCSTTCSKINNTETQTKHKNARSGCYKNLFIYISACVGAYLTVLFYNDNSSIHFSNSPTQLLTQKTQATTTGVSGHVFSGKRIRTFTFTKQHLKQTTPSDILLTTSKCTRWGVVTTINAPTQSIYNVLNQTKLCLVIVADLKTPTKKYLALEKKHDVVSFLSVEDQKAMQDFEITSELPWNHFGRKNLGFVYAIQHGAKVVFDFDDDNELISNIPSMIKNQSWWVADNTQVFNPYPTFVNLADVAWPRGFPLTQIQNISTWKVPSYSTNNANIGVVQSLANHDPDMDSIWRLTRKLPLNFESNKRVVLPPGTYSSYNAQATIHYALWGMLLPVSVHGRVSDIWRSYIMQRLMHDVGQVIGFVSPFVKQVRNEHSYQGDYMSERPLYEKTEALIQVVSQWKGRSNKFEERFVELFVELYERNFIELKDVYLAQKWIRTLQQMNFKFPHISEISNKSTLFTKKLQSLLPRIPRLKHFMVTGGAGYIGSHATAYLLEQGHRVTVVDNLSRGSQNPILIFSEAYPSRFTFYNINIGNTDQLDDLFSKYSYDAVWHFAAVAFTKESVEKPELYHQNITVNTQILATAMKKHKITELVYSSTCAVYGVPVNLPITEETPTNPSNPYGKAKLAAENILKKMSTSSFKVRILRYFNVIGAYPLALIGENPRPELEKYSRLWTVCLDVIAGRRSGLSIRGDKFDTVDGTGVRDYVHVWDLVRAHLSVMDAPGHFSIYNVATGNPTTVKQFADACATVSKVEFPVDYTPARPYDPPILYADPAKIFRDLNWKPSYINIVDSLRTAWHYTVSKKKQEKQEKCVPSEITQIVDVPVPDRINIDIGVFEPETGPYPKWTEPSQVPAFTSQSTNFNGCTLVEVEANGSSKTIQGAGLPHTVHLVRFQKLMKDTTKYMKAQFSSGFRIFIDTADTSSCKDTGYSSGSKLSTPRIFPFPVTGNAFQPLAFLSFPLPLHKYHQHMENIVKFVDPMKYNQKTEKAIWHGSASGYLEWTKAFRPEMTQTPREKVIAIAAKNPSLLEASFIKTSWLNVLKFKYIVAVSGNSWSSLLSEALWSNSVVLRQDSIMYEWYESMMIPWTHYIPVKYDLSDLISRIQWAKAHPVECNKIAQAATAFALKFFNEAAKLKYTYNTIEYNMPKLIPPSSQSPPHSTTSTPPSSTVNPTTTPSNTTKDIQLPKVPIYLCQDYIDTNNGLWVDVPSLSHSSFQCCGWDGHSFLYKEKSTCIKQPDHPCAYHGQCSSSGPLNGLSVQGGNACYCDTKVRPMKWVPSTCTLVDFDAVKFCSYMGKRRLLVVGDSTIQQTSAYLTNTVYRQLGANGCQSQIYFRAADTLVHKNLGHMNRGKEWMEYVKEVQPDIVLVGVGPHITLLKDYVSTIDQVKKEYLEWKGKPFKLIFQTQFSAGCGKQANKRLPPWDKYIWRGKKSSYNYHLFLPFDNYLRFAFALTEGVQILDIGPLLWRNDRHPGVHSTSAGGDCLHSCSPGPLSVIPRLLLQKFVLGLLEA